MLRALSLVLAMTLAAADASATLVIDDLELESFALQAMNGSGEFSVQELGSNPMHCFNDFREPRLISDDNSTTTATLSPSPGPDGVIFDSIRGGYFELGYLRVFSGPIDLTQGGSLDRIQVYCSAVIPAGSISVKIFDEIGPKAIGDEVSQFVFAPGMFDFDLSDYAIDVTRAMYVVVTFDSENHSGRFVIDDIRVMRPLSLRMLYVPEIVDFQFPPLPSPPCMFVTMNPFFQNLFYVEQSVLSAHADGFVPFMEGELLPAAQPEEPMTLACTWLDERPFQTTEMTMLLELGTFGGGFFEMGTPGLTESSNCFALTIPVVSENGGLASSVVNVTFDPAPGQSVQIVGAEVSAVQRSSNSIEVTFQIEQTGPVDFGEPLFTITWNGESGEGYLPTGAPDQLAGAAPASAAGAFLVAPSVTRAGAEIRFAAPRAIPATLEVHDVSGRCVASRVIPAGAVATLWDGLAASGEPTPAGVYFLSVEDADGRSTGRLTRIR